MQVVFVTQVRGEDGRIEMRYVLIAVIASGIGVVEVESYVEALVGIDSKLGIDMVLTVGLVATVVVEYIGIGREGVHKQECLRPFLCKGVGRGEDEYIIDHRAVDEDPAQTGGVVVTRVVVLSIGATVEGGVHEEVGHGVRHSRNHIAELPVDGPHIDALGYHLVFGGVVVVFVEFRIVAALRHVAPLVDLVEGVLGTDGCQCQQCNENQTQSFSHSVISSFAEPILRS